jgi:hypothetical protein
MKTITASDRKTLIRLASSLPVGDDTRKAILTGLRTADCGGAGYTSSDWDGVGKPGAGGLCNDIYHEYGSGVSKDKKKYNKEYQSYVDGGNQGRSNCPGPAENPQPGVKCNR